jgi:hypothetical protein
LYFWRGLTGSAATCKTQQIENRSAVKMLFII